jgi:hypothetical protein
MSEEPTCSQCSMPLDPDQVGIKDNDGDIICHECLAADPDTE